MQDRSRRDVPDKTYANHEGSFYSSKSLLGGGGLPASGREVVIASKIQLWICACSLLSASFCAAARYVLVYFHLALYNSVVLTLGTHCMRGVICVPMPEDAVM
jgi:hypothetical protein